MTKNKKLTCHLNDRIEKLEVFVTRIDKLDDLNKKYEMLASEILKHRDDLADLHNVSRETSIIYGPVKNDIKKEISS